MRTTVWVSVLLFAIAPLVTAQDAPAEADVTVGADLKPEQVMRGMRVRITLGPRRTFSGIATDTSGGRIWIDVSLQAAGASSQLGFKCSDIERVELLDPLTEEQAAIIKAQAAKKLGAQQTHAAQAEQEITERSEARLQRLRAAGVAEEERAEQEREAEMRQRYTEILSEYPPEEGWSEDMVNQIMQREIMLDLMRTEKEADFIDNIDLWKSAYEWQQSEEKKAEKEASEAVTDTGIMPKSEAEKEEEASPPVEAATEEPAEEAPEEATTEEATEEDSASDDQGEPEGGEDSAADERLL